MQASHGRDRSSLSVAELKRSRHRKTIDAAPLARVRLKMVDHPGECDSFATRQAPSSYAPGGAMKQEQVGGSGGMQGLGENRLSDLGATSPAWRPRPLAAGLACFMGLGVVALAGCGESPAPGTGEKVSEQGQAA